MEENAGHSNTEADGKAWTSLWSMQVLSKIKVFLWRLAQHSLPTSDLLNHRNMSDTLVCTLCGAEDSWRHALVSCNMARCVWSLSSEVMVEHMSLNMDGNARNWLFHMHETMPQDEFITMVVTLWAIWSARRKAIHKKIYQSPFATHSFILSYLSDLKVLQKPARTSPRKPTPRPAHWIAPLADHMKINVDAAISRAGDFGAVGAICKNQNGKFMVASGIVFRNIDDPATLESLAIREALALAEDLYVQSFCIASDCKTAVEAIKEGSAASYGAIIHEITVRSSSFISCEFRHEYRSSNFKAHNLAKHILTLGAGRHAWLGQPADLLFVPENILAG